MSEKVSRKAPIRRVRLTHWNSDEAKGRAESLKSAGYRVDYGPFRSGFLKELRLQPPLAIVIDLSRLPSHGRDVALALREYKPTRTIPLVFSKRKSN